MKPPKRVRLIDKTEEQTINYLFSNFYALISDAQASITKPPKRVRLSDKQAEKAINEMFSNLYAGKHSNPPKKIILLDREAEKTINENFENAYMATLSTPTIDSVQAFSEDDSSYIKSSCSEVQYAEYYVWRIRNSQEDWREELSEENEITISGLKTGTTYFLKVQARSSTSFSLWSAEIEVTTPLEARK